MRLKPIVLDALRCGITGGMAPADSNARLRSLGCGWCRMPLLWSQVQADTGRQAVANWVQRLRAEVPGVKLLITFRAWLGGAHQTPMPNLTNYRSALCALLDAVDAEAWQVENEWDSGYWWAGSLAQYRELLDVAVPVIRDHGKLALLGGITSDTSDIGWKMATGKIVTTPAQKTRMAAMLDLIKNAPYDVADVHCYHELSTVAARVKWAKSLTNNRPLWVTETGGPDPRVATYTEAAQATDLPKRLQACLTAATQAFWLGLYEQPEQGATYAHMGLIRQDGTAKPAYGAYQKAIGGG